jgi:hypothetical protein
MEKHRITRKITEWNSIDLRPRGRFKMRWEEDVKHVFESYENLHWKKKAKMRNEF